MVELLLISLQRLSANLVLLYAILCTYLIHNSLPDIVFIIFIRLFVRLGVLDFYLVGLGLLCFSLFFVVFGTAE